MCKKTQFKYCPSKIDECMQRLIQFINFETHLTTLASCCGHGKYNMSIIVRTKQGRIYDLMSCVQIPRKKRFYKKDAKGYYYIPETNTPLKEGSQ